MLTKEKTKSKEDLLSKARQVTILETEPRAGYGRSARVFASVVFCATDFVVLVACFAAGGLLYRQEATREFLPFFDTYLIYISLYLIAFLLYGLYPGFCFAPAEELRRYTIATFFMTAVSLAVDTRFFLEFSGDEQVYLVVWLMSVPLLWGCRVFARSLAARSRAWGVPAVVFGSGKEARDLVDRLLRCRWIGYTPRLMITDTPRNGSNYRGIPVIYGYSAGLKAALSRRFSTALVALPAANLAKYREVVQRYAKAFPTFITFSDLLGMTGIWARVRDFEGVIGLSTRQKLLMPLNALTKRLLDVLGVCFVGIPALPFCLLMALLIRLDSPGPAFYWHQRLGKNGRALSVLKFRTMVLDADAHLSRWLEEDPSLNEEWNHNHKLKSDPRVTRAGRFLRATSLDELPQLWNVLRGEMSLVGPRPIVKKEVRHYGSAFRKVFSVLPGMSGLWQVSGRSDTDYAKRVELDTYYIQNWSIWLDVFILVKTLWIVLTRKGAF